MLPLSKLTTGIPERFKTSSRACLILSVPATSVGTSFIQYGAHSGTFEGSETGLRAAKWIPGSSHICFGLGLCNFQAQTAHNRFRHYCGTQFLAICRPKLVGLSNPKQISILMPKSVLIYFEPKQHQGDFETDAKICFGQCAGPGRATFWPKQPKANFVTDTKNCLGQLQANAAQHRFRHCCGHICWVIFRPTLPRRD